MDRLFGSSVCHWGCLGSYEDDLFQEFWISNHVFWNLYQDNFNGAELLSVSFWNKGGKEHDSFLRCNSYGISCESGGVRLKKISLVMIEEDREYAQMLALAIRRKEKDGIEAAWYTDVEHYRENRERRQENLILVGEEFQEQSLLHSIQKENPGSGLVLLSQDGISREISGYPVIEKYRPADAIIKEIYRYAAEYACEDVYWPEHQKQIVGIYAPWNQELSMLFAEVLLQLLAEKQQVLYVSLQECIGRKGYSEDRREENLADFISFLRLHKGGVGARLKSICKRLGRGSCIPSVDNPQNIADMTRMDYLNLWKALKEQSEYEGILLEFGCSYPGSWEDMKQCQVIYCPYQEEALQEVRRQQVEHIVKLHEAEEILERMHYVKLPRLVCYNRIGERQEEELAEELLCSEFGDTVRGLVGSCER